MKSIQFRLWYPYQAIPKSEKVELWVLPQVTTMNGRKECGTSAGETGTQWTHSPPHYIDASMLAVKGYLEFLNRINVTKLYRPGNSPELNQIENLENCQKQSCRLVYQFNSQHALLTRRSNQKQNTDRWTIWFEMNRELRHVQICQSNWVIH